MEQKIIDFTRVVMTRAVCDVFLEKADDLRNSSTECSGERLIHTREIERYAGYWKPYFSTNRYVPEHVFRTCLIEADETLKYVLKIRQQIENKNFGAMLERHSKVIINWLEAYGITRAALGAS